MSLQDALSNAQAALIAVTAAEQTAHEIVVKAQADVAAATAAIEASMPHLDLLTKIESYAAHLPTEVVVEFHQLVADAKALF